MADKMERTEVCHELCRKSCVAFLDFNLPAWIPVPGIDVNIVLVVCVFPSCNSFAPFFGVSLVCVRNVCACFQGNLVSVKCIELLVDVKSVITATSALSFLPAIAIPPKKL